MTNWTINGIEGVWMTKNELATLTQEIERLRRAEGTGEKCASPRRIDRGQYDDNKTTDTIPRG